MVQGKATPSKAPLPKKPTKPREVKNPAINAQRFAQYERELAQWEKDKAVYDAGQFERRAMKRKKQAVEHESAATGRTRRAITLSRSSAR